MDAITNYSLQFPGMQDKHDSTKAKFNGYVYPAQYLNTDKNNCSACHEPHNPKYGLGMQERRDWKKSGHGNLYSDAWTHYDFTLKDNCNVCHTASGFIYAIGTSWSNTKALSTTGSAKMPLTCDTCHSSNQFNTSVRTIPGVYKAGMGGFGTAAKATVRFANQGLSNLCIPCHSGVENGASLIAGNYDFTNTAFVNPHYLPSAAVWQGKAGYQWYTADRYSANRPTHGVMSPELTSVAYPITDSNIAMSTKLGSCVACHMGGKGKHTFNVYSSVKFKNYTSTTADTGCLGCHSGTNNGFDKMYPTMSTQPGSMNGGAYVTDVALDFLRWQLEQVGIYYSKTAYPYFFTKNYVAQVSNWTTQVAAADNVGAQTAQQLGIQTMGAAMNLATLTGDRGASVHNAAFTKALIADSLVFLQHGSVGDRFSTAPINNISFTAYSTARIPLGGTDGRLPVAGNPSSISNLKGFLTSGGLRR